MYENKMGNIATKRSNLLFSLSTISCSFLKFHVQRLLLQKACYSVSKRTEVTASYIFGTMHTEDKRVLALPPLVKAGL